MPPSLILRRSTAPFLALAALAFTLSACASPGAYTAASPTSKSAAAIAPVDSNLVRSFLSVLADDSMDGRGTGTAGSRRAARFIANEMREIGLEPVGDSGYLQRVPLARTPKGLATIRDWASADSLPADGKVIDANVVGVLRGSDPVLRDEYILIDAHYDHLGIGPAVNGDSIYNGADDDASGVVAVLSIARALAAGPRPKRSIIFLTTTGEELGLLGTRWYVMHPVIPLNKVVANLEIEMIGRPDSLAGGEGRAWLTGFERSSMGPSFAAAGLAIVADMRPDQQFFMRSDNIAFARRGIPAHTLSSYGMHNDYHHPSDDMQHVDIPHMTAVIHSATRAVALLANGPVPVWAPGGKP